MKKLFLLFVFFISVITVFAQTSGTLTVSTVTSSTDPNDLTGASCTSCTYAPKNVLAIWIEDASGKFIKSISVWAAPMTANPVGRRYCLSAWMAKSNQDLTGLTVNPSIKPNPLDGQTGATLQAYKTINCSWNGKDVNGVVVPDGVYFVKYELTDMETNIPYAPVKDSGLGDGINTYLSVQFTKGPASVSLTPADVTSFGTNKVTWTPSSTGINNSEFDNLYSVYPNPAKKSIFVSGPDIQQVEILNLSSKSLLKSTQTSINVSSLKSGSYIVRIYTNNGVVNKKIIKE